MNTHFVKAFLVVAAIFLFSGCASTSDVELAREQAAAAQKTANEAKMSADAALIAAEAAKTAAEEAKQSADATNSKMDQVFRKSMRK